jgi:hypothetical protein
MARPRRPSKQERDKELAEALSQLPVGQEPDAEWWEALRKKTVEAYGEAAVPEEGGESTE